MTKRRSWRRAGLGSGLVAIAALALGCTSGPLHVDNGTDIPVSVYADGSWVGTYAPGTSGSASIAGRDRPQTLEVRSPSGAVLLSLPLNDAQLKDAAAGGYGTGSSTGLPCGVVTVVIGQLAPDEALAPAAGAEPGPCP